MLACWHQSWEMQLHVQPWTEGGENCASSSVTWTQIRSQELICLLPVVVFIRMRRIRRGWVLLLTLLTSARECVTGCVCSIKEGPLIWDRGWQSGQLKNPLQDAQTHGNMFINKGQGKNHMHSHAHPLDLGLEMDASVVWYLLELCALQAQLRQGTGGRLTQVACFLAAVLWQ